MTIFDPKNKPDIIMTSFKVSLDLVVLSKRETELYIKKRTFEVGKKIDSIYD
jgi:hypothetical protein